MREVPPGLKLRVLLAQALFSRPDVLLLDEPTNNLDIHSIRWLEGALNDYDATMIIISHDRHFLNQVCTHIADLDFQQLKIYPGNYDDFMLASVQARAARRGRERQGARTRSRTCRSSCGASRPTPPRRARRPRARSSWRRSRSRRSGPPRARIPTSASSRRKKLYRSAVDGREAELPLPGHRRRRCSKNISFNDRGRRARRHHRPERHRQDDADALPRRRAAPRPRARSAGSRTPSPATCRRIRRRSSRTKIDLFTWMSQWTGKADDDQLVRATLGRLLFSGDETKKSVKVLSGGEKGRMIYGKLMLTKPNVLLMDEPTNHMDMETIESLQIGLEKYPGTLVFVSHDREFVGGLATRIIELRPGGQISDFRGTYDEYLAAQGLDH